MEGGRARGAGRTETYENIGSGAAVFLHIFGMMMMMTSSNREEAGSLFAPLALANSYSSRQCVRLVSHGLPLLLLLPI